MPTLILTLLLGVAYARANAMDQSDGSIPDEQPMVSQENRDDQSRMETPQVVLQLKYDRGELNKIYLAQFRKTSDGQSPSPVLARTSLCADLCHAGLGGGVCGATCLSLVPVGLEASLSSPAHPADPADPGEAGAGAGHSAAVFGEPRVGVCPALCHNQLGEPLCNCSARFPEIQPTNSVDWSGVCHAFCDTDGYTLGGCPRCEELPTGSPAQPIVTSGLARVLNSEEGWVAWCSVQCRQGHGGAACNCDRSPLQ